MIITLGKKGNIPNGSYYDKWYPEFQWGATTIISNAIGQGEILVTPIQLANMVAAIGNRGYYYTPHIIKQIEGETIDKNYTTAKHTTIDKENFEVEFPFTVPHEYKGSFDIELVAKVREQKDSVRYTVITNTNK